MSKRKNKIGLDLGAADVARLDGDTVAELKELISKLAASSDVVGALEQGNLSSMVTFLKSFESDAAENKFILHHVTKSTLEKNPESLMRWAMVFMLRHSKMTADQLQREVLGLLPTRQH